MIRIASLASFAALALATAPVAQVQVFGGDSPRMSSTKMIFNAQFEMLGAICIQYGQPKWKAEYEEMADSLKGKSHRLGKDFWSTMNTTTAFTMGGVKVAAGAYYLGIKCDDEGGFHLLVIDAKKSDKNGWTPFNAEAWEADFTVPLTKATSKESVEALTISLSGNTPDALELKLAWGTHSFTAATSAHVAGAKDEKAAKPAKPGKQG